MIDGTDKMSEKYTTSRINNKWDKGMGGRVVGVRGEVPSQVLSGLST